MPGEYESHTGCWILWPFRPDIWPFGAKLAQHSFAKVITEIARFESVTVGVNQENVSDARRMLPSQVRVVEISYDDAWIRDTGPTFVVNDAGETRGIDWDFNAWGGLYSPWDRDALVARKVLEIEGVNHYRAGMVLEGGAIHVDGDGTLLVTEECLLNRNRNPNLNKTEIEERLREYLDVEKIIWLGKGLYLDETGGHIDNLCCFVRPGVVVMNWTDDKTDPQYDIVADAFERLSSSVDARGRALEIHRIHQPEPLYLSLEESRGIDIVEGTIPRKEGDRLTASYVNFYIANGGVIAPTFDDFHDSNALNILQKLFPNREVVSVPVRDILSGGGGIHCIVQQKPCSKMALH